jgi:hypothetical protein
MTKVLSFIFLLFSNTIVLISQTQISFSTSQSVGRNFQQGDQIAIGVNFGVNTRQRFEIDTLQIQFDLRANAGYLYTELDTTAYLLPTQNDIFSEVIFTYPVSEYMNPFISGNLTSTPLVGFIMRGRDMVSTTQFRDPITTTQNTGLSYTHIKGRSNFTTRFGYTLRQIRASKHTMTTDDRTTPDIIENYRSFQGISYRAEYRTLLDSMVNYRGFFDAFRSTEKNDKWVMRVENEITANILKIFQFSLRSDIWYDVNQSLKLQFNNMLQFGIIVRV